MIPSKFPHVAVVLLPKKIVCLMEEVNHPSKESGTPAKVWKDLICPPLAKSPNRLCQTPHSSLRFHTLVLFFKLSTVNIKYHLKHPEIGPKPDSFSFDRIGLKEHVFMCSNVASEQLKTPPRKSQ